MSINSKTKAAVDLLLTDSTTTEAEFQTGLQDVTTELDNIQQNYIATSAIGSTVQGYDAGLAYLDGLNFTNEATFKQGVNLEVGVDVQAYDAGLAYLDGLNFTNEATFKQGVNLEIGVDVQGYDVDTLKADVADTLTAPFRGTVTTDNDLSFNMNVTNNFTCTPTGTGTLTFTNITSGQSGMILLVNGSNYSISAAATTKITTTDLATISTTGTYLLTYFSNGTNVYVVVSGDLT